MENQLRNEKLWKLAKLRAGFKKHLAYYVLVNVFLWGIWWFTAGQYGANTGPVPWPAWASLGWGLGLGLNYFEAYGAGHGQDATEREYDKLMQERQKDK